MGNSDSSAKSQESFFSWAKLDTFLNCQVTSGNWPSWLTLLSFWHTYAFYALVQRLVSSWVALCSQYFLCSNVVINRFLIARKIVKEINCSPIWMCIISGIAEQMRDWKFVLIFSRSSQNAQRPKEKAGRGVGSSAVSIFRCQTGTYWKIRHQWVNDTVSLK